MNEPYPMLFKPVLKDYIWGGRNLEKFGRILPDSGIVAESWEISSHKDGISLMASMLENPYRTSRNCWERTW